MPEFYKFLNANTRSWSARAQKATGILVLSGILCMLAPVHLVAAPEPTTSRATNVSDQVHVMNSGFGRNRSTNVWTATLKVTNKSAALINGPVQVVLTNLSANAAMVNQSGVQNGSPYITVTPGPLAAGASATVVIQFTNPSNGFINFTPVTYSGSFINVQ